MADFGLTPTTYTVAEYCGMLNRNEIIVNNEYQRSDKVWPPTAQSFLIETILLGFPLPKLSLHQKTDVRTRKTVKEIVDGQQRTKAIKEFYDDKLRLSRALDLEEACNRNYSDLPENLKKAFLNYPIAVDLFTGATSDQIREVFRRINSYTVPLNPEEQRHAIYQGEMKWFIYKLSHDYDEYMLKTGTFTLGRLVRMADAKLYSEITHALLNGIVTTKKKQLDDLYKQNDDEFAEGKQFSKRFEDAMDVVIGMSELHRSPLMRPHVIYSLLLAIMHVMRPIKSLLPLLKLERGHVPDVSRATAALSILSEALNTETPSADLKPFALASAERTNVKGQRETRFIYLAKALARA